MRDGLFAATVLVFWPVRVYFVPFGHRLWMPLVLAAVVVPLIMTPKHIEAVYCHFFALNCDLSTGLGHN
jgi:uncharacterized membrane protein YoaT (DUF817 family)